MALLFCLQFGGYTISSVNFAAFVLAAVLLGAYRLFEGFSRAAICAPFMLLSLVGFLGDDEVMQAFMRIAREIVALGVILAASFATRSRRIRPVVVDRAITIAIAILFLYTGVQWLSLNVVGEPWLFIHWSFYGLIGGNLHLGGDVGSVVPSFILDTWSRAGILEQSMHRLRPAAFYSEPSYLGMVLLGLVFALTCGRSWRLGFILPVVMALITVAFLAQSASGVLALVVYLTINFRAEFKRNFFTVMFVAVPIAAFLLMAPSERVSSGIAMESDETSGTARLITPLSIIENVFSEGHYAGVPFAFIGQLDLPTEGGQGSGPEGSHGFDNGVFNLFILYGVGGVMLLIMLWLRFSFVEFVYILLIAVSNGAFFSFDKAFLISMTILYVRMRTRRPRRSRKVRRA